MPYATQIAKIIFLIAGLHVNGYAEGVGAYAVEPGTWFNVCVDRNRHGWVPDGVVLDCSHSCLVSAIEPEHVGEWWLVDVPGASMHYCQVVDCGAEEHLDELRERGEVVEIPYWLAMEAGWTGYTEGVRVWRLRR